MKRFLLLSITVCLLLSCSKSSDSNQIKPDNGLILGEISTDRTNVGVQQIVTLKTTKPKNSGEIVQYRWVVIAPDGDKQETVNYSTELKFLTSEISGEYNVELYAESLAKEGKAVIKFNTKKNDFIQAIFGNPLELIESSCLEVGKKRVDGLVGYYWPFDNERPSKSIKFDEGRFREAYLFNDNKFIGGTREIYSIPFDTRSDGKGGVVSNSYINYLSIAIELGKEVFGNEGKTDLTWRLNIPQSDKDRYLDGGNDYNSALGWAMHEGALVDVITTWEDSNKIGKAQLKRNSASNFSIYFVVVKK